MAMKIKKLWSKLPRKVQDAINRYANARSVYDFKGAKDPEDWPAIDKELEEAREAVAKLLMTYEDIRVETKL